MSPQFSMKVSDQLQPRQISLVDPKILQCHQGMAQLTPSLKKWPFTKV